MADAPLRKLRVILSRKITSDLPVRFDVNMRKGSRRDDVSLTLR